MTLFERDADGLEKFAFARTIETSPRRTAALARRCNLCDASRPFGDLGGKAAHQAFENLKFRHDLAALPRCSGLDDCAGVIDSESDVVEDLIETARQVGDSAFGNSARATIAGVGIDLQTSQRQYTTGKETCHSACEQEYCNRDGGAEQQVDCNDQCPRHASSADSPGDHRRFDISNSLTKQNQVA